MSPPSAGGSDSGRGTVEDEGDYDEVKKLFKGSSWE